jgi:hypothetical protein
MIRTSWVRYPSRTTSLVTWASHFTSIASFFEWDVKPRFLVPECRDRVSKRSHTRSKCATCCGLPFFKIAVVNMQNARLYCKHRRRRQGNKHAMCMVFQFQIYKTLLLVRTNRDLINVLAHYSGRGYPRHPENLSVKSISLVFETSMISKPYI